MDTSKIDETIASISLADADWRNRARCRLEQLTMPHWALGKLMDLAVDLAGITRTLTPSLERRTVIVMAADHGVAAEGVSAYPPDVTRQMVLNFVHGGAAINVLSEQMGARVIIVDMGVNEGFQDIPYTDSILSKRVGPGTRNMTQGSPMTREQAVKSVMTGIEIASSLAAETDVFVAGDMGIGNTTAASAITSVLCKCNPDDVTGHGTGIDLTNRLKKAGKIRNAIQLNKPNPEYPLDVLAKVGGFEIGGIAGVMIAAAAQRKPIILDGVISTAGALIAQGLCPAVTQYMVASHLGAEPGHSIALKQLGKEPLLHMDLQLGEGTGAVLALPLLESAIRIMNRMATFDSAGVSRQSV